MTKGLHKTVPKMRKDFLIFELTDSGMSINRNKINNTNYKPDRVFQHKKAVVLPSSTLGPQGQVSRSEAKERKL